MARTQVYYIAKGHLGQYEDWWYLDQKDDGTVEIVNEWDHVSVNGLGKNEGSKSYSLDAGLKEAPHKAVAKIKELLGMQ
ncbi:hypothetical protein J5277_09570 [Rhizobium sp. 16-449-1b]|uniref:hypothetical protein n=1 Tax=Rhizobium sp. 16-449-1b TaxID=2819989 RepID=UPI001ADD3022|nr:hypothetical protein [Rhizobium sp. 16-449-1b]MBO9194353.1 hypothetical protein [Rhizobium sp. 16-449-1b]